MDGQAELAYNDTPRQKIEYDVFLWCYNIRSEEHHKSALVNGKDICDRNTNSMNNVSCLWFAKQGPLLTTW